MAVIVKSIGILITGMGIGFLLNPETVKRVISFFGQGKRIYLAGCLRIVIGILLLLGASQCKWSAFVISLGILTLLAGILILILGPERLRPFFEWWQRKSTSVLRLFILIPVVLGILLIYSV